MILDGLVRFTHQLLKWRIEQAEMAVYPKTHYYLKAISLVVPGVHRPKYGILGVWHVR